MKSSADCISVEVRENNLKGEALHLQCIIIRIIIMHSIPFANVNIFYSMCGNHHDLSFPTNGEVAGHYDERMKQTDMFHLLSSN